MSLKASYLNKLTHKAKGTKEYKYFESGNLTLNIKTSSNTILKIGSGIELLLGFFCENPGKFCNFHKNP